MLVRSRFWSVFALALRPMQAAALAIIIAILAGPILLLFANT